MPRSLPLCLYYSTGFVLCQAFFLDFFGSSCRPLPFNPLVLLHLTPLQAGLDFFASGRCWFTFIFRTTGLHAVEDFVRGVLRTLMGHTLTISVSWALLPIPHFCLDYSTPFGVCQAFFYFFWGSSLFVSLFIPPESCSYFVNAESGLQRIFASYNLAGVVSQSAAKRGGLTQALLPRRLIKGFQLSRIPLFVI